VYDLTSEQLNELASMCFAAFHAAYNMRDRILDAQMGMKRNDDEKAKAKTS
jgi:hypothetical protein